MKVRFFNFSKRKNSTKIPSAGYTEKDVELKYNTSVHDPVLTMSGGVNVGWNYAYIPTFDRYYFIRDYVSVANGITEYYLTEDVMGSHVSEISACSCRVAFCTNPYYSNINDPRIAVKTARSQKQSTSTNIIDPALMGFYVLTVLSNQGSPLGIGDVYYLNAANMRNFAQALCDTSVSSALIQLFSGKVQDAVLSVNWLPFIPPSAGDNYVTQVSKIAIGDTDTDAATGVSISALKPTTYHVKDISVTLAIHKTYPKTDFRAIEPYTTGMLYLPGVGNVTVSMADLVEGDTIRVDVGQDYITGDCHYTIKNANGDIIQTANCNMAAACPIGQIAVNGAGIMNGIKTSALGFAAFAAGIGSGAIAAGAMLTGAANAVLSSAQHAPSINGSVTGRFYEDYRIIYTEFSQITEDPEDSSGYIAIKGRPLGEVVTISSCSGYIECDNASVSISGSDQERDEINAIMNSGFYYET